jgi:hypothetical protein
MFKSESSSRRSAGGWPRSLIRSLITAGLVLCLALPTVPAFAAGTPVRVEAESGPLVGMPRSNASGYRTIVLTAGQSLSRSFVVPCAGLWSMSARYSNDGGGEEVVASIDGQSVGRFTTRDTRVPGQPFGSGWNTFATAYFGSVDLAAGSHNFVVTATAGLVEIDVAIFELIPGRPPPQILLEAEDGSDAGQVMMRSNANPPLRRTVWLRAGQTRRFTFTSAPAIGKYAVRVRYSNDNFGPTELLMGTLDGDRIGSFAAADTGDNGNGWNVFVWSPNIGPVDLQPGTHQLAISVSGGDGFGVEIDLVALDRIG